MTIAQDVLNALIEAGEDVSGQSFNLRFDPANNDKPWALDADPEPFVIPVMDSGIKKRLVEGQSEPIAMRRLLVPSVGYVPAIGDKTTISGRIHVVAAVEPVAPFGEPLMYRVFLGT